jgi:hypothetical protein
LAKKKSKKPVKSGPSTSVWIAIIAGLVVVVGVAGGVLGWTLTHGGSDNGTSSPKPPSFAFDSTAPKGSVAAYQFAIDYPDVLAQIPCYCGCGQEAGHKSNLDCFIKSRNGDDIVFDKHAAG